MSNENMSHLEESQDEATLVEQTNETTTRKSPPKTSKKSIKKKKNNKKQRKQKRKQSYSVYIHRVLKQVHPDLSISNKSMNIMNSFVEDLFDRIADEAAKLSNLGGKGKTISNRAIQSAVRLVLPDELARHAISEGTKALHKFSNSK